MARGRFLCGNGCSAATSAEDLVGGFPPVVGRPLPSSAVAGHAWRRVGVVVATLALTATGCGGASGDDASNAPERDGHGAASSTTDAPSATAPGPAAGAGGTSLVAEAKPASVPVYAAAGDDEPTSSLDNPNENGAPLVFLVKERQGDWLNVYLPVRPNGSTGWVNSADVTVVSNPYSMDITLGAHRLEVHKGDEVVLDEPIAVGTAETPTPGGTYYIKELLRPPNPDGPYGPYAYGLSGFSNVLDEFNGGDGVIGIHGTNDPEVIGTDVSHGCIRLRNEAILELVPVLPLGTPVHIAA
jgi:lipoprotein-anchoring transpeptidase ErfK/SrfK